MNEPINAGHFETNLVDNPLELYGKERPVDQPGLIEYYRPIFASGINIDSIINTGATEATPINDFIEQAVSWYATEAANHEYPTLLNHVATYGKNEAALIDMLLQKLSLERLLRGSEEGDMQYNSAKVQLKRIDRQTHMLQMSG